MIAHNLNFNVPRAKKIFFKVHAPVAKGIFRFRRSIPPSRGKLRRTLDDPHSLPAASCDRFQHDGKTNPGSRCQRVVEILDGIHRAGDRWNACLTRDEAGSRF